jgi:hypothetical protein
MAINGVQTQLIFSLLVFIEHDWHRHMWPQNIWGGETDRKSCIYMEPFLLTVKQAAGILQQNISGKKPSVENSQ